MKISKRVKTEKRGAESKRQQDWHITPKKRTGRVILTTHIHIWCLEGYIYRSPRCWMIATSQRSTHGDFLSSAKTRNVQKWPHIGRGEGVSKRQRLSFQAVQERITKYQDRFSRCCLAPNLSPITSHRPRQSDSPNRRKEALPINTPSYSLTFSKRLHTLATFGTGRFEATCQHIHGHTPRKEWYFGI